MHTSAAAVRLVLIVGLAHLVLLATAGHICVHGLVGDDLLTHAYTSLTNFPAVVVFCWAASSICSTLCLRSTLGSIPTALSCS